jgi:hypothetical protein
MKYALESLGGRCGAAVPGGLGIGGPTSRPPPASSCRSPEEERRASAHLIATDREAVWLQQQVRVVGSTCRSLTGSLLKGYATHARIATSSQY